jgi:RNA polymerase sigma-70 factor (ECF subfamily)
MPRTDGELATCALAGEKRAFEQIIQRYQKLVFNIIYHYTGRHADVEDIAQEVFLKVYQTLDRYDPARPLKHWIGRITANRCLDELRRRKRSRESMLSQFDTSDQDRIQMLYESTPIDSGVSDEDSAECMRLLETAMQDLSDKDRMAYVLREVEDLEYADVAAIMHTSQVAARIRVSRAKQQLRSQMEKLLDG